jgi:hypothetical protein
VNNIEKWFMNDFCVICMPEIPTLANSAIIRVYRQRNDRVVTAQAIREAADSDLGEREIRSIFSRNHGKLIKAILDLTKKI